MSAFHYIDYACYRIPVKGVYQFYKTTGLPLDVLLMFLEEHGLQPDWYNVLEEAKKHRTKLSTLKAKFKQPVIDVYGKDEWPGLENYWDNCGFLR